MRSAPSVQPGWRLNYGEVPNKALGLALDAGGFVQVDTMTRETSVPGIYAAGDLVMAMQGAPLAAASGTAAAGMLNHALTVELALEGLLA